MADQFGAEYAPTSTSQTLNFWAYIAFCVGVSIMTVTLIVRTGLRHPNEKLTQSPSVDDAVEADGPREGVPKPAETPFITLADRTMPFLSPELHLRVKRLFELRYTGLALHYSADHDVLFGIYDSIGARNLFVFFARNDSPGVLSTAAQEHFIERAQQDVLPHFQSGLDNPTTVYLVAEDTVKILAPPAKRIFDFKAVNESELADRLINFQNYLASLIRSYEERPLPFAHSQRTLAQTFIPPYFNEGNSDLDQHLDTWIADDRSRTQKVILADYGMGKTSFLRHYAHRLALRCRTEQSVRIPLFIELTSRSPIHGGIGLLLQSFVAVNLGVPYELFEELRARGRFVFLLDAFDEMGFIGSDRARREQIEAIIQMVESTDTKLILTGRASYFSMEDRLQRAFRLWDFDSSVPSDVNTFRFERVDLDPLTRSQMKQYLGRYYARNEAENHWEFISGNSAILELCARPSLMHIVRHMIPDLVTRGLADRPITAFGLMRDYARYWIRRQMDKGIASELTIDDKETVIWLFFQELAVTHYRAGQGNLALDLSDISNQLVPLFERFHLTDGDSQEGLAAEMRTAYFIERSGNTFKFVHKSFLEYFVAAGIVQWVFEVRVEESIFSENWSPEIEDFVGQAIEEQRPEPVGEGSVSQSLLDLAIHGGNRQGKEESQREQDVRVKLKVAKVAGEVLSRAFSVQGMVFVLAVAVVWWHLAYMVVVIFLGLSMGLRRYEALQPWLAWSERDPVKARGTGSLGDELWMFALGHCYTIGKRAVVWLRIPRLVRLSSIPFLIWASFLSVSTGYLNIHGTEGLLSGTLASVRAMCLTLAAPFAYLAVIVPLLGLLILGGVCYFGGILGGKGMAVLPIAFVLKSHALELGQSRDHTGRKWRRLLNLLLWLRIGGFKVYRGVLGWGPVHMQSIRFLGGEVRCTSGKYADVVFKGARFKG